MLRALGGDRFESISGWNRGQWCSPLAIRAIAKLGVDLSGQESKTVDRYLDHSFDKVITVCDQANEACPVFFGARERVRWSFPDPSMPPATRSARFSHVGGPVDSLVGLGFFLDALGLIGMFTILAVKLVRRGTGGSDGLVLLGLRYAIGATMLAFAAGLWMISLQSRYTGAEGNILPLHALGFHALQAIPVVAWLFSRSAIPDQEAGRWVHAAGATWLAACLGIAWQTAAGR